MLLSLLGLLLILAPLVIVHEFGHYLFALLFNVKAEAFSVGFGPSIFSKKIGETEWKVSLIPFGGYVKLLGEDPNSPLSATEKKRALPYQPAWKRFFIFLGGPLFNFLWAILIFSAITAIGEQYHTSTVGRVLKNSPAMEEGFKVGDEIISVNGEATPKFEDVIRTFSTYPGKQIDLVVLRKGAETPTNLKVTPKLIPGQNEYGEETTLGMIEGLFPAGRSNVLGISNLDSAAGKVGMRTGDQIATFNKNEIISWEQVEGLYEALPANTDFEMEFMGKDHKKAIARFTKPARTKSLENDLGLYSSELFLDQTVPGTPAAEESTLKKGDRFVSVNGVMLTDFFKLKELIQQSGEKNVAAEIVVEREGHLVSEKITPKASTSRDPSLNKVIAYTIGIVPMLSWDNGKTAIERETNPFLMLWKGTKKMSILTYKNLVSIQKMFTGSVSVKTLGGPILISKIAGDSLSRGLIDFLSTMAVLSIGLGVLNLLPVPVLDGGHILLLGLEVIRRKPLSLKQLEIIQTMGFSLIVLLMFVVMKNDIARLSIFN